MRGGAMESIKIFLRKIASASLVVKILIGLVLGAVLGLAAPKLEWLALFGDLFVGALKATAPVLVFYTLRKSALTAFFTRSSAANIPVNMHFCEKLGLDKDMYSVSIPLGSTINMDGAAVVITTLTLVAAHTAGIHVSLPMAILLSIVATLSACGTSGVAGGSLLLVPLGCSMIGLPNEIAMEMVGIGFIISVIQDSMETALNSSGDALFTATAEFRAWKKEGREIPF